jgi:hypothetical protein
MIPPTPLGRTADADGGMISRVAGEVNLFLSQDKDKLLRRLRLLTEKKMAP